MQLSLFHDAPSILLKKMRKIGPLVLHWTNHVVVEEQAHATLAFGGRPLMSFSTQEAEELTQIANVVVLNIGTIHSHQLACMEISLQMALKKRIPVLLDPVGYGASILRTKAVNHLLSLGNIGIIKGNAAEICGLAGMDASVSGVDALGDFEISQLKDACMHLAKKHDAVVIATGSTDVITSNQFAVSIHGGSIWMKYITGSGCMAGSIVASLLTVCKNEFEAGILGIAAIKTCAEKAAKNSNGPGTFFSHFMDALYHVNGDELDIENKIKWI